MTDKKYRRYEDVVDELRRVLDDIAFSLDTDEEMRDAARLALGYEEDEPCW